MRVIAPDGFRKTTGLLLLAAALSLFAQPVFCAEPAAALAQLASALSQNDAVNALAVFDPKMAGYGVIESNISALVSQSDVLCAIDILQEKDAAGQDGSEKELDVDWYLQVKSQADPGNVERRRQTVVLRMRNFAGKWKITAISAPGIVAPVTVRQ
jgi:hypothetical protein